MRFLLSLLLVLSFSSGAIGAELLERFENAELYKISGKKRQLVIGGDIENALPFDETTNVYKPWNLVFAEGTPVGNWTWLGKGTIGYLIKPSTSTVRMYPVRGDQTKYIEIAPIATQPSIVNQISAKSLELYVDQPNTRWSLSMTPQGFKPNILLKSGYTGDGTFQFRFELNGGLTLNGAKIMDGATQVLKMHNPFLVDAEGINRAVDEELVDGVVTLTADLTGLTLPILVDPTLGPINPSKDTYLRKNSPLDGHGQGVTLIMRGIAADVRRMLLQFDISAIPAGSTITTSSLDLYLSNIFGSGTPTYTAYRVTRTDWEDAGNGTANAEANWDNFKDPNVAWTAGGGDFSATETGGPYTFVAVASVFYSHDVASLCQDALDNRSGILSTLFKWDNEATGTQFSIYDSLESATAAQRPKLTVEYELGGDPSTHLGYRFMEFF